MERDWLLGGGGGWEGGRRRARSREGRDMKERELREGDCRMEVGSGERVLNSF